MKDSTSVVEANLAYAVRIVNSKFASVEDAARTCGVDLADLQAQLANPATQHATTQQKRLFENFDR